MPRTVTVLLIAILALTVNAAALPARSRIVQLLESSNYDRMSLELRLALKKDPAEFSDNNYDYLLATVEEKRGDYASAIQNYHAAAVRDPDLRPYALKHLSQIIRSTGNLAFERLFLNEILFGAPNRILHGPARIRLVRNQFESGDFGRVIESLSNGTADSPEPITEEIGRDMLLLLGNAYLKEKKFGEARDVYDELIESVSDKERPDDFALEAVKGLDILDNGASKLGVEVAGLSAAEHKQRADIYQFNRNFPLARLHYNAIYENHRADKIRPASIYQIARGYDQERNYVKSLLWYRKIIFEYPEIDLSAQALYGTAGALANLDDTADTVAAYRKYIEENPKAGNLERAYLNIVDAYRDAGDNEQAVEWSKRIQNLFSGKMGEAVALFAEAQIHISENRWDRALPVLKRLRGMKDLGGSRIAGGTNTSEVDFMTAFVLENLGRVEEAVDGYLNIPDGRGEYYGWRATERLQQLSGSTRHRTAVLLKIKELEKQKSGRKPADARIAEQKILRLKDKPSETGVKTIYSGQKGYSEIPEFTFKLPEAIPHTAEKLLILGLYDEATPEIETSLRKKLNLPGDDLSDFDDDMAFTLAVNYLKGGFADRSIRFIEPKWKRIPGDFQIELIPKAQAELLYPIPFRDELLKYGKKENVDPRFLLAIMRQESRFQTDVKSAAAARGLMQFISSTSREIALELEMERFSRDDLYDPETSIKFGSRYLANLFKQFPEQRQAVAAGYNAGEDRMARWLKRSATDDPDRYVPEVVFTQTKLYVFRVMANYRMYSYLYDENLEPRKSN